MIKISTISTRPGQNSGIYIDTYMINLNVIYIYIRNKDLLFKSFCRIINPTMYTALEQCGRNALGDYVSPATADVHSTECTG